MTRTCPRARVVPGGAFQTCAAISLLVGSVLCVGGLPVLAKAPVVVGLGLAALVPFLLHRAWGRTREGLQVEVAGGLMRLGARRVDIEEVAGAFVRGPRSLVLDLVDRTRIELELGEDGAPEEVLAAFGWDPEVRTLRAPLRGPLGAFTVGFVSFILAMWPATTVSERLLGPKGGAMILALVSAALASAAMIRLFAKPHVVLGADGVRVVRGPGRERFVPYASIASVDAEAGDVVTVTLAAGKTLELPTVGQERAQVDALRARIEAGRAAAVAQGAGLATLLDRGGRAFATWMKDLGGVAQREAGFRSAAISPEMLERELADTTAPAERRIAAAVALRVATEGDARRVRIAADTCAEPELRAALEAVCEDALGEEHVERAERRRV